MLDVTALFALIAAVLTVSGLASGLIERAPLSFPIIFLGLGFLFGSTGVIELGPHSAVLEAVAFLVLALVLFLDAQRLESSVLRAAGIMPILSLGPGTIITVAIVAVAAHFLLTLSTVESLIVGTALASTDPVVLRDVVRNRRLPSAVREALSIEAGTNDIVVLPVLLVLIAVAKADTMGVIGWLMFAGQVLVLGPAIGFVIGAAGAWMMSKADAAFGIRREHQALYGIGLVLLAFTAAQWAGGDGFLASFAAGLAVALLNINLCDCFLDYGETTAEAAMLLAFVLFGAVISQIASQVPMAMTLLLAAVALLLARPLAIGLALRRATVSWQARAFIGWFGPRGLSSLLLALLVLEARVPHAEYLLAIIGVVVTISVIAHGVTATPLSALYAHTVESKTLIEERKGNAAGLFGERGEDAPRISPTELAEQLAGARPPLVLDIRTRSQYRLDHTRIPGSIRVLPDDVGAWAAQRLATSAPDPRAIVAYCTCPDDATSMAAARQLRKKGFEAAALAGGFEAWKSENPVEPIEAVAVPA
jgi:sodium/hydrogen antiporter